MFKRLFLCLLLTTDLYSVEQGKKDTLSTTAMTAVVVVAGALVFAMYASDEQKFEELTLKISDGDITKILEVAGAWLVFTQVLEGLIYAPTRCKETYEDWFPTEEQKTVSLAKQKAAHEKLKYLKAEESFLNCIIDSKPGCEKNSSGRPTICEELAQAFMAVGGSEEVARMTDDLKEFWK